MFCFRGQPLLSLCCMPARDCDGLSWGWAHMGKHPTGAKGGDSSEVQLVLVGLNCVWGSAVWCQPGAGEGSCQLLTAGHSSRALWHSCNLTTACPVGKSVHCSLLRKVKALRAQSSSTSSKEIAVVLKRKLYLSRKTVTTDQHNSMAN